MRNESLELAAADSLGATKSICVARRLLCGLFTRPAIDASCGLGRGRATSHRSRLLTTPLVEPHLSTSQVALCRLFWSILTGSATNADQTRDV